MLLTININDWAIFDDVLHRSISLIEKEWAFFLQTSRFSLTLFGIKQHLIERARVRSRSKQAPFRSGCKFGLKMTTGFTWRGESKSGPQVRKIGSSITRNFNLTYNSLRDRKARRVNVQGKYVEPSLYPMNDWMPETPLIVGAVLI